MEKTKIVLAYSRLKCLKVELLSNKNFWLELSTGKSWQASCPNTYLSLHSYKIVSTAGTYRGILCRSIKTIYNPSEQIWFVHLLRFKFRRPLINVRHWIRLCGTSVDYIYWRKIRSSEVFHRLWETCLAINDGQSLVLPSLSTSFAEECDSCTLQERLKNMELVHFFSETSCLNSCIAEFLYFFSKSWCDTA